MLMRSQLLRHVLHHSGPVYKPISGSGQPVIHMGTRPRGRPCTSNCPVERSSVSTPPPPPPRLHSCFALSCLSPCSTCSPDNGCGFLLNCRLLRPNTVHTRSLERGKRCWRDIGCARRGLIVVISNIFQTTQDKLDRVVLKTWRVAERAM